MGRCSKLQYFCNQSPCINTDCNDNSDSDFDFNSKTKTESESKTKSKTENTIMKNRKQKSLFDEVMKPIIALAVIVYIVGHGMIILADFLQRHLVWVN